MSTKAKCVPCRQATESQLERCARQAKAQREAKASRPIRHHPTGSLEALEWLSTNPNPHPFASNRFSRVQIISLVRSLYAAGARKVVVANVHSEPWRIQQEGGPYADTLMVNVPANRQALASLKSVIASAQPDEHHQKGSNVRLWWD